MSAIACPNCKTALAGTIGWDLVTDTGHCPFCGVRVADYVDVRVTDLDDGSETVCSLREFLTANAEAFDVDSKERRTLLSGERVTIGGGAAPAFAIEVMP